MSMDRDQMLERLKSLPDARLAELIFRFQLRQRSDCAFRDVTKSLVFW